MRETQSRKKNPLREGGDDYAWPPDLGKSGHSESNADGIREDRLKDEGRA